MVSALAQVPGLEELDPGMFDDGWQFFAARAVEERFSLQRHLAAVVSHRAGSSQVIRSQSGPMSGLPFTAIHSSPTFRFCPQLFRVLLLRLVCGFPCLCPGGDTPSTSDVVAACRHLPLVPAL